VSAIFELTMVRAIEFAKPNVKSGLIIQPRVTAQLEERTVKYLLLSAAVAIALFNANSARAQEVTLVAPGTFRAYSRQSGCFEYNYFAWFGCKLSFCTLQFVSSPT
jgi:LAS superfamily LD-carboxypeptidase LdcB